MMRKALMLGCLSLAVTTGGWAQQAPAAGGGGNTGGGNAGGGTGGGGTTGNPGGGGTNGGGFGTIGGQQGGRNQQDPFGQQQNPFGQMERPIYLSGEVRLANGEIPPEPVRIERICNGQNRPEGYTDLKGRFNFQVGGNNSAALTDASYSGFGQSGNGMNGAGNFGGMGGAGTSFDGSLDLSGCELRASLAGFRSDQIMLTRRRSMDNPDVGVIVLHPLAGFQGEIVSATTLTAPKKAKANYDKGVRELRKSEPKFDKAAQYLEAAVAEHPKFASAWTWLAEARLRLDDQEGAEEALTKAIEADPAYIRPYEPLVQIALRKEDWPRVAELADATLRMYPGHTQIRYYKAVAAYRLGQIEVAEATAREIAAGSDAKAFPHAYQMMGVIYAQKGSFPQAADSFRTYLEMSPQAPSAEQIRKQLNEWEALGVIKPAETAEAK